MEAEELVRRLMKADASAAEPLCERLLPAIDRAVREASGGVTEEHFDRVQDTFERVVESVRQGELRRASDLERLAASLARQTVTAPGRKHAGRTRAAHSRANTKAGPPSEPSSAAEHTERLELERYRISGSLKRFIREQRLAAQTTGWLGWVMRYRSMGAVVASVFVLVGFYVLQFRAERTERLRDSNTPTPAAPEAESATDAGISAGESAPAAVPPKPKIEY